MSSSFESRPDFVYMLLTISQARHSITHPHVLFSAILRACQHTSVTHFTVTTKFTLEAYMAVTVNMWLMTDG